MRTYEKSNFIHEESSKFVIQKIRAHFAYFYAHHPFSVTEYTDSNSTNKKLHTPSHTIPYHPTPSHTIRWGQVSVGTSFGGDTAFNSNKKISRKKNHRNFSGFVGLFLLLLVDSIWSVTFTHPIPPSYSPPTPPSVLLSLLIRYAGLTIQICPGLWSLI
jgi:hypothetical protein